MAIFAGPEIVNSGLVLHLDAANSRSYPGSGTNFKDIASNTNLIISGTSSFSSNNTGYIILDSVDDYIDFTAPNLGNTASVEMWCRPSDFNGKMLFGWLRYDVFCSGGAIGYNTAASDVYGLTSTQVTNLGMLNNWKQYVFVMRTDVSYTNNKIYVNGANQSLSQVSAAESAGNRTFNSGAGRIAGWRNDTNYRMPMNLGSFKLYNRELTAAEIKQNFEASRDRYGI